MTFLGETRRVEDIILVRTAQDRVENHLDTVQGRAPSVPAMRAMADMRQRADSLFRDLEMVPPQPAASDNPERYRLRLLNALQPYAPSWRDVHMHRLWGPALTAAEGEIYREAAATAADPTQGSFVRPGQLRELRRRDQGGAESVSYSGDPRSWTQMFAPPTKTTVTAFTDGRGRVLPPR